MVADVLGAIHAISSGRIMRRAGGAIKSNATPRIAGLMASAASPTPAHGVDSRAAQCLSGKCRRFRISTRRRNSEIDAIRADDEADCCPSIFPFHRFLRALIANMAVSPFMASEAASDARRNQGRRDGMPRKYDNQPENAAARCLFDCRNPEIARFRAPSRQRQMMAPLDRHSLKRPAEASNVEGGALAMHIAFH